MAQAPTEYPRADPRTRRTTSLPISAERAWDLVTDVRNHARWLPWTRVDARGGLTIGETFSAASGPTSWGGGLTDRMQVDRLDPPSPPGHDADGDEAVLLLRRLGPTLLGSREIRIRPTGPTSCRLSWVERAYVRRLPRPLTAPLLWPVLAATSWRARRRITAEMRITRR